MALTTGPADLPGRVIVVGEGAHIYGARAGSARFDPCMSDADRGDIINGIWLCRNCHKIVDADPLQFPAELLFEWRREHERSIMAQLGKPGLMRQKVLQQKLEGFESCTYLAQQIIIDRPSHWEHKLTAELLRSDISPIRQRWEALEKGLYALPLKLVSRSEAPTWMQACMKHGGAQARALNGLLNGTLQVAWGPPGMPGSEQEIRRVCSLIAESCQRLLDIEEDVRFSFVPEPFEEVHELLIGIHGRHIDKVSEISPWISSVLAGDPPSGEHRLSIVLELPGGWNERVEAAVDLAIGRLPDYEA